MTHLQWRLRSRIVLAGAFAAMAVFAASAHPEPGTWNPEEQDAPRGQGAARGAGQAAPAARGNFASNFTGTIALQQTTGTNMSRIRFEAGARTNWHTHTAPQILLIEEGRGRWQEMGDVVKDLPMGQPVLTKPNLLHWHGAAPDQAAVQFSVYGGDLEWKQAVTDDEYLGKKK